MTSPTNAVPDAVDFVIEVARGAFAKRALDGRIEFPSPVPCPFNYGSAPAFRSADGENADVVVLGPRLPRGHRGRMAVVACVQFIDAGVPDDKWICSDRPLRRRDRAALIAFFYSYARLKRWTAPFRGRSADSRMVRIDLLSLTDPHRE